MGLSYLCTNESTVQLSAWNSVDEYVALAYFFFLCSKLCMQGFVTVSDEYSCQQKYVFAIGVFRNEHAKHPACGVHGEFDPSPRGQGSNLSLDSRVVFIRQQCT